MNRLRLIAVLLCIQTSLLAQNPDATDEQMIRNFYDLSLLDGQSYQWLDYLSNDIGGRLSGSKQAQLAVDYTYAELNKLGLDSVWLQPVMVPHWVRGPKEVAWISNADGKKKMVNVCALGGSVGANIEGAAVIEVQGIQDLARYGREQIEGKIVFYNRPMQANLINTFQAYGGCVDQRYAGAMEAQKYGAIGVVVRSMTLRQDDFPHTGSMGYGDLAEEDKIPAVAISTNDADVLSTALKSNKSAAFSLTMDCQTLPDVQSYNVIGELRGSEFPDKYFVVGGHLDSWDTGDGSHDDGAGCVQSMDVLRLLKNANYKPKHSIRVVMFMNEENGLRGGREYAKMANENGEDHIFALESDAGGFSPLGFAFDCDDANFDQVLSWKPLFEPYLTQSFTRGGSGADIGPLKKEGIVLSGLRPDSQRYFDYHHAPNDTFEAINKRELELGAAAMTSLVYLFDKYGIK
ncbi:MAG: M28 family peptidase [Gilvibacter sp.]